MAKLSVVVPFYNVEDYIEAALESLARQTLSDLEVVLVDDGSVDGSAIIAKSYVSRDPRFHLIQQANAGPGPSRNAGIRHATGEYLAFFDGDDLLDPHAYHLLTTSLEKTGSDIATGGCTKFGPSGRITSWLHEEPFRRTTLRTHVSRFPVLLQDRTTTNKVFRRSFWDAHGLEFPAGLYEDPPVAIRAHVLASSVDVLQDVVYYWRVRDSGQLSTTQRSREMRNVEQRMASVGEVARLLAVNAPALKPAFDGSVLKGDLALLVEAFELATDADRARIAELAAGYLGTVDASAYHAVPAFRRLHYYLISHGMLPDLLEVLRSARLDPVNMTPVVRRDSRQARWCARYPFFGDPTRGIPDDVYDITSEMTLKAGVDSAEWHGGKLRIEGHAYIRNLSSATPSECQVRVTLRNSRTHRAIRLPVQRVWRPDVTALSGQGAVCYDWSGFAVEVDPRRLATLPGVWRAASWELTLQVSGGGLRRDGPVCDVPSGTAQWPEGRWVTGSVWLQPASEHDGRFVIRGQQVDALVTACTAADGVLDIEGWTSRPLSADAMVVAAPRKGGVAAVRVHAEPAPAHGAGSDGQNGKQGAHAFRAKIPVRKLVSSLDAGSLIDRAIHVHDEFTWDISISPSVGGATTRLAIAPGTAGARVACNRREVTAFATHFGYLSLLERTLRPVVTELEWTGEQHLVLRGDYSDPATRPTEFLLRHPYSGSEHAVRVSWDDDAFIAEFAPGRMPGLADRLPLASGSWHLLARAGETEVAVVAARRLLSGLPGYHRIGLHEVEAQPYHTDAIRFHVRTAHADDERSLYAVRRLMTEFYPKAAARPVLELAVFDSFSSRHYACNPRAIFEELRRSHPELECAWVTADGQFSVQDGTHVILAHSREHFEALARARYVIANDNMPRWFRKREGQLCLQTWHGTPLKRIGLDIGRPQFPSGLIYRDLLRESVANWDVLLSPNRFSTTIFRGAFGFGGEILESGYPRNDALHRPDREERAAAIRRQLGLPAHKRIILYAPTWRDDAARPSGGDYRFDLQLDVSAMAEALGDDHVLLLRLHTNVRNSTPARITNDFVTGVTAYPDITDLLLISDVLITDYSSVMFDFAGTGRPMLFFTYDMASYRDQLRGFYLDFEAEAPGPLLATSAEVIEALRGIRDVELSYRDAYKAFADTYCALDDGKAASRVVSRLLADQ
jgi:CDP-glycerol glycerophosphotransferase